MASPNKLLQALPYPVEQALVVLGNNLRAARLRRNLTIKEVAEKIGTGTRAVRDAENGKPSTGIATYMALLWVFDLLEPINNLAALSQDEEGQILASARERSRSRPSSGTDNDF